MEGSDISASVHTKMSQTKGDASLRQKDFDAALLHYTRAIALVPSHDREGCVVHVCLDVF